MSLIDLHPTWRESYGTKYLFFDCPRCQRGEGRYPGDGCWINIPVSGANAWRWNGETDFDKVTLAPSIWHHCKSDPHFFIREGKVIFA